MTWRGTSLSPVSHSEEISVSRIFDAPRELVYRAFVDPDQLCQWFGPAGFSVPYETVQSDARPGGFQRFVLVSDADPSHRTPVDVALSEVVEDELLVAHADIGAIADAGRTARIRLRLEFLDQSSGRTRLKLRRTLPPRDMQRPGGSWETRHPARLPVAALAVATAGSCGDDEPWLTGYRATAGRCLFSQAGLAYAVVAVLRQECGRPPGGRSLREGGVT